MPQKYIKRKTKPVAIYGETGEENQIQWITKSVGTFTGGGGGGTGTVDTEMSDTSTNAVQNKVIKEYVDTADENLTKVMPTDINTDSNGYLILEHDGKEITGQKKQVLVPKYDSRLKRFEISGGLHTSDLITSDKPIISYTSIAVGSPDFDAEPWMEAVDNGDIKFHTYWYDETTEEGYEPTFVFNASSYKSSSQSIILTNSNVKTIAGNSIVGSGNIAITASNVGLGNVENKTLDTIVTANSTNYITSGAVKTYVDNQTVNKLDKITNTSDKSRVYVVSPENVTSLVEVSLLPSNGNIAQFDTGGHLYTEECSIDTHCANKKYVDDAVSGISLGIDVINIEYNPDTLAPVGTYDVSVFETAKKRTTKVLLTATGESYGILCDKTLENLDETEPNLMFASGLDEAHNYYVIDMDLRDGSLIIQISKEQGQAALESGVNIKTVNGESLLGSGNITIETIKVVEISDVPAEATNGTLTDEQLTTLQSYDGNYIMFNHEKYYLQDKGHIEGYLTYTHTGYENNQMWLKSITVTIATKAWVLNVVGVKPTAVLTQSEYDALTEKDANTLYYIIG